MKGSKYDTEKNGMCAAKECKNVLLIADTRGVDPKMLAGDRQASAKKIGITFTVRAIEGAYPTIQTPSKNIPIAERPGWGKDYADAVHVLQPAVRRPRRSSRTATRTTRSSASRRRQCKELKVTGNCTERAERQRGSRQVREPRRHAALRCYARARPEAHDAGRAVGSVPLGVRDPHRRART